MVYWLAHRHEYIHRSDKIKANVLQGQLKSLELQQNLWRVGFDYVNMILFVDLYCIIRQPFKPQSTRIKYYVGVMVMYLLIWGLLIEFSNTFSAENLLFSRAICIIIFFLISSYCIIAIICLLQKLHGKCREW